MKPTYLKKRKNSCVDGIAKGYTEEYVNEKKKDGYFEISEEEYNYYYIDLDLAINYDFESPVD